MKVKARFETIPGENGFNFYFVKQSRNRTKSILSTSNRPSNQGTLLTDGTKG